MSDYPKIMTRAGVEITVGGSAEEAEKRAEGFVAPGDAPVVTPQTDLAVVYLPGLDIAQHALLGQRGAGDDASNQAPSTLSMRLEALNSYYAALDKLLAPLLQPAEDEIVVVVTEPGRVGGDEAAWLSMKGGPTD